jgi:hypothetical protein
MLGLNSGKQSDGLVSKSQASSSQQMNIHLEKNALENP